MPDWQFHMLKDSVRNQAYERSIQRAVERIGQAPVFDMGAGCGLLSMIARRAGASAVVGAECVGHIQETAKQVISDNQLSRIDIVSADVRSIFEPHFPLVARELTVSSGCSAAGLDR